MADDTKPAKSTVADATAAKPSLDEVQAKAAALTASSTARNELLAKLNEATAAEAKAQAELDAAKSALRAASDAI